MRLQKKFGNQAVIVLETHTQGGWASKGLVSGEEEVEHLRKYYTVQHELTFPIALFEGKKHETEDGGSLPEPDPNFDAFGVFGYPQVVVVDQKGVIRQVLPTLSRDDEERISTKLMQLIKEGGASVSSSSSK